MSQGRCPGCGEMNQVNVIYGHLVSCPEYARLYREYPERALSPVAEYQRWLGEEKSAEQATRVAAKVADTDGRRAAMADRFRTRDPLEDE